MVKWMQDGKQDAKLVGAKPWKCEDRPKFTAPIFEVSSAKEYENVKMGPWAIMSENYNRKRERLYQGLCQALLICE